MMQFELELVAVVMVVTIFLSSVAARVTYFPYLYLWYTEFSITRYLFLLFCCVDDGISFGIFELKLYENRIIG